MGSDMAKRIVRKLINSQSKLAANVLKTILKTRKVKEQIYMKRSPKFCYTK